MATIKEVIPKIGKFWKKHQVKVNKVLKFSDAVLSDANTILIGKTPNVLRYASFAIKVKNSYAAHFKNNAWNEFSALWEMLFGSDELGFAVADYLLKFFPTEIITRKEDGANGTQFYCNEKYDFVIGWNLTNDQSPSDVHIENGKTDNFTKWFGDEFWGKYGDFVSLATHNGNLKFSADPDYEFFPSKTAEFYAAYLKKFTDKNKSRTILFYGPCGTGKSNIVRAIAQELKLKSLRFNITDFKEISTECVHNIVKLLHPDVVILEDIDHAPLNQDCQILATIELLNKKGKLIIATTNEVKTISHAVLRPGRFDQLIEISKFDEKILLELVGQDREIFEIVKDYPIASVMELMTRIEVLGRAEALATMEDIAKRVENMQKTYNCTL